MEEEKQICESFPLFSKKKSNPNHLLIPKPPISQNFRLTDTGSANTDIAEFTQLGLAECLLKTCSSLGMKKPFPIQQNCIPRILAGNDVLGIAQTGSGKTATFVLPILHKLAENPYGVFALVVTPTRELADQLFKQFNALGSCLNVRCSLVIGGMNMMNQAHCLKQHPHVVVETPGRIKALVEDYPDVLAVFRKTKFLVLDEADRLLDVGFEAELRVIFNCLPKNRQTLLFSATMTTDLQTLLEISANTTYFYKAYGGFTTVESLKQHYVFIPNVVKDVYLIHILSKMEDMGIRSAIVFASTCRTCQFLNGLFQELGHSVAALHSLNSQALRFSALYRFKSRQVPILLCTDVASRGLDIPTVDLVINYDIPSNPRDYIHRVGRTARAGRGGMAVSLITQNDINLIHQIEADIGKQLEEYECKEAEVLAAFTKVTKARRVAKMILKDDGFEEKAKARKAQKLKSLAEKGRLGNGEK